MSNAPPHRGPLADLLRQRLGAERLAPYEGACGSDVESALALYEWNAEVSSAFHTTLGMLEVLLRNAMHEELARWHARTRGAGSWYDDPDGILDAHRRRDIADARRRLARDGKVETPGRIVAELTFGFWRYLLTKRYERTLWTPAVRHAFPHLRPARRSTLYTSVDTLLRLRNRVAHHEPIHNRPLIALHDDLLRVVSYMDPDVAVWTGERSRVPTMLALRPASPSRRAPQ